MLNLQTIHKPKTLEQALQLVRESDTVIMAGGTALISEKRRDVRAVIDLSELGLSFIETRGDALVIGATTTLAAVVDSELLREAANGVIAQAAHQTHANLLRNQATVAGTLISEPAGVFAVGLSALEARVVLTNLQNARIEQVEIPIADFLAQRATRLQNSIVTEIKITASARQRRAALESVGRTPRDKAIVSVCAALEIERGIVSSGAIALGGVGETAWRARDAEREILNQGLTDDVVERAAMAATSALEPLGDFRGSAQYRTEMARVLTARALKTVRS
jgi:aerobic carbon-monoxide dehydrogenase medium subunit